MRSICRRTLNFGGFSRQKFLLEKKKKKKRSTIDKKKNNKDIEKKRWKRGESRNR
jgi:hypothetical protein